MPDDDVTTPTRGRPIDASLSPAIMDAVLSLLAEDGYARLTTARVAERAGVSTATLYRRWPSKRNLLLAAARQIGGPEATGEDSGSAEGDLRALLVHKREVLSGRIGATLAALAGEAAHDHELAAIVRTSILDPTREHLIAIVERARERGESANPDVDAAARLIVGAILARAVFPGTGDGGLLPESDMTMLVHAILGSALDPGSGPGWSRRRTGRS